MLDYTRSLGVTSIQHPGGGNAQTYQRMMDEGRLTVRVDVAGTFTAEPARLDRYEELRDQYPQEGDWIRFGYLKGFIDGTLGSGTAMFFEPFEDEPDKRGLPQMSYEELEEKIVASDARGFQVGIHAIGTEANNWILNAFEKAQEVNGVRGQPAPERARPGSQSIRISHGSQSWVSSPPCSPPTASPTSASLKNGSGWRGAREPTPGGVFWTPGPKLAFGTDYSVETSSTSRGHLRLCDSKGSHG